jgi:hypothetical protein
MNRPQDHLRGEQPLGSAVGGCLLPLWTPHAFVSKSKHLDLRVPYGAVSISILACTYTVCEKKPTLCTCTIRLKYN